METIEQLRKALPQRPEMRETLELHIALLETRARVNPPAPPPLPPGVAEECLARGEPLLNAVTLAPDWSDLARAFGRICAVAAAHRSAEADAFRALAGIADNLEELREAVTEHLENTAHPARRPASAATYEATLLDFALNQALHPFLNVYARTWQPLASAETWYRSWCPICGGPADMAALLPGGGARRLLCARCDAEWQALRSACPFCGETTPGRLAYTVSQDGVYRLYTCDTCRRYLKTIDLRELAFPVHLPAERVLTVGMDLMAISSGYQSV
ncbi:MAG: formate dehydrogenase accessory protein FdhE [Oscillochloridaceae bacterium]|nr:formate dehydrogenase accessory protein FdhE [Chloroflexaceae bacterium]MDW8390958.1 formate dehydrogenase accessory protein FdhE [Oscillochloridaceae bacterium]